jgi:hypothetical protein
MKIVLITEQCLKHLHQLRNKVREEGHWKSWVSSFSNNQAEMRMILQMITALPSIFKTQWNPYDSGDLNNQLILASWRQLSSHLSIGDIVMSGSASGLAEPLGNHQSIAARFALLFYHAWSVLHNIHAFTLFYVMSFLWVLSSFWDSWSFYLQSFFFKLACLHGWCFMSMISPSHS